MRILLSDGSGLTARQVVTRLSALGHEVEAVSSTWWCLTRFTVHVRRIHRVPPFQTDAPGWFKALLDILQKRAIDVLLPTQEQVAWLSAYRRQISVPTVLPDFSALSRVEDKIAAFETLTALATPQPMGCVVRSPTEKREDMAFPVFVKRPISTASSGVRRADDVAGLASAMSELGDDQFLVQEAVPGPVAMVQTVADDGRLVALHANMRLREGAGGGAAVKESALVPALATHLRRLIEHLRWHGPLSCDLVLGAAGPVIIDINPRLVEPMNAWFAGVDILGTILTLARGEHPPPQPESRPGVRSRQLLVGILGAAEHFRTRRAVLAELNTALSCTGDYRGAAEELTPWKCDPLALVPVGAATVATLSWPSSWRWFAEGAVRHYALTPSVWRELITRATTGGH